MDYEYTPLFGSASIRIIHLQGSKDYDFPIHFSLWKISLDRAAKYDALSYTWGDQAHKVTITCEGKRLYVTPNCEAALRQLRPKKPTQTLLLWVDAICIDQSSIEERNAQVEIMGKIYSKANRVLMWLGSSATELQDAPQHLSKLPRSLKIRGEGFLLNIRSQSVKQGLCWVLRKLARFGKYSLSISEISTYTNMI